MAARIRIRGAHQAPVRGRPRWGAADAGELAPPPNKAAESESRFLLTLSAVSSHDEGDVVLLRRALDKLVEVCT